MESCFDIREIPHLADLAPDDPRRRHLAACPRCRGLAEAQALFLAPGDTSDLSDLAAADTRLQHRLAAAWTGPAAAPAGRGRRGWLALAAVLAVCALGLTAGEVWRLRTGLAPQPGGHLRGDANQLELTVAAQDGVLRLDWAKAPDADSYLFLFFGADLAETGRRVAKQSLLDLRPVDLPAATEFCQVFALSHGDTLARSTIVRTPPARE